MTTYQTTGDQVREARETAQRMMDQYHPELRDAEVTFAILMASPPRDKNGDPTGPAVSLHGYPCAAKIKRTPYEYRTLHVPDCLIYVDSDWWECLTTRQRDALLDHELEHLTLAVDAEGACQRDDCERPKLQMRKHDRTVEGFDIVVRRHGPAAPEHMAWTKFEEARTQQWLFGDLGPDPEEEPSDDDDLGVEITAGHQTVATTLGGLKRAARTMENIQ